MLRTCLTAVNGEEPDVLRCEAMVVSSAVFSCKSSELSSLTGRANETLLTLIIKITNRKSTIWLAHETHNTATSFAD